MTGLCSVPRPNEHQKKTPLPNGPVAYRLETKKAACFENRSRPLMDEIWLSRVDLRGERPPLQKLAPRAFELVAEDRPNTKSVDNHVL